MLSIKVSFLDHVKCSFNYFFTILVIPPRLRGHGVGHGANDQVSAASIPIRGEGRRGRG